MSFFELLLRPRYRTLRATLRHVRDPEAAAAAFAALGVNPGADPGMGGPVGLDRPEPRLMETVTDVAFRAPADLRAETGGDVRIRSGRRNAFRRAGEWTASEMAPGQHALQLDPLFWWLELRQAAGAFDWGDAVTADCCGRPGLRALGLPRRPFLKLGSVLTGFAWEAETLELVLDAERGLPLRAASWHGDRLLECTEVTAVVYDDPLGDELFVAG